MPKPMTMASSAWRERLSQILRDGLMIRGEVNAHQGPAIMPRTRCMLQLAIRNIVLTFDSVFSPHQIRGDLPYVRCNAQGMVTLC